MTITTDAYNGLQRAYDHFNEAIFDGALPECLITLSFHRSAYGYFRHEPFAQREGEEEVETEERLDEIALNPFTFPSRTDREIFSTLVHEMVHLWQHHYGHPKKTHHDKEWAAKMESIGLMPSSTGAPGGKRTGRRVSHWIIDGGAYDEAQKLCDVEITLNAQMPENTRKHRKRHRYVCPHNGCDLKVSGKAELHLICGDHKRKLEDTSLDEDEGAGEDA